MKTRKQKIRQERPEEMQETRQLKVEKREERKQLEVKKEKLKKVKPKKEKLKKERFGRKFRFVERFINYVKCRSRIALAVANRRFTAVLSLTLKSGMELEKGMELARELVDNEKVAERISRCSEQLQAGDGSTISSLPLLP